MVHHLWWKEAVVYQIYPRSFKDSNGDGIGDLKGIISKLDYIKSLGVDAVWLNPIYESPNVDNGYDISNYEKIMPVFGTMADFDTLLHGLHQRGIKLIMDLVVNHTSDRNEWFIQSRSSRTNPYRNFYHWWPAEKGIPTPRYSDFDVNKNAWMYDSLTYSYYLHYFSRQQPDLNWENPKVRQAVYKIMNFWLKKGIDGFRMDAIQFIAKDTTFPEFPKGYEKNIIKYYGMGPHIHDYLQEMNRDVLSKYPNIMTVSEGAGSSFEDAHKLVDANRQELNIAYQFDIMDIGNNPDKRYTLIDLKRIISRWDSAFSHHGWLAFFLGNHDVPRMVSKFGNDSPKYRNVSSKLLTTLILTMHGTPFYYQGDELGMTNIYFDTISEYRDIAAINGFKHIHEIHGNIRQYMKKLAFTSRDNSRTPFQWDTTANAGFTTGNPWIAVNPNYKTINVEVEEYDPNSCLNYFRKMVQLRKSNPILIYGSYHLIAPNDPNIYAYTRALKDQKILVILNFTQSDQCFELPQNATIHQVLINNYADFQVSGKLAELKPYQAVVLKLN
ncbi:MAG: glycoside hydrolase family 13 protein [Microbacter sp.]